MELLQAIQVFVVVSVVLLSTIFPFVDFVTWLLQWLVSVSITGMHALKTIEITNDDCDDDIAGIAA